MDLDLRDLDAGFRNMKSAGRNMRKVWERLKPEMKADQLDHWKQQESGDGKWAPRAASTRRRHGKRRKLFSKRFASGFSMVSNARELAAISKIPYADAHQFGAEGIGKNGRTNIPARPFLYLSEDFIAIALPEIAKHLGKAWSRR